MNKAELVNYLADHEGVSKSRAERMLDALTKRILSVLSAGDSVSLTGLGKLETVKRAARRGRNPKTGAAIDIPASRTVVFRPGKALKNTVNGCGRS